MEWRPADLAPADRALWDAMGDARPRYSPMPTPGAPHELSAFDFLAAMLRRPAIPWQRWFVRVASERAGHRYRFPEVDATVQRQTGKTTTALELFATRAVGRRGRRSYVTAQTGKDAVARWGDLTSALGASPIGSLWTPRSQSGSQRITFRPTGSYVAPFAPTPDSLHGYTPHDVQIDEAFAFDAQSGADLQAAIIPAQQTIADRQLIVTSTRGDARARWHNDRVTSGRLTVDNPAGRAYLEWSLAPELDPHDEANWVVHPGLGHLVTLDDLRVIHDSVDDGLWRRAFMNQPTEAVNPLFDLDGWDAGAVDSLDPLPPLSECAIGYAVEGEPARSAVVAAWPLSDESVAVKLVYADDASASELAAWLAGNIAPARPRCVVADDGGLTRLAIDIVGRDAAGDVWGDTPRESLRSAEWIVASAGLSSAIAAGRVVHEVADEPLSAATIGALPRPMGESWALSHRSRAEVLAMAAAVRRVVARAHEAPPPFIDWG